MRILARANVVCLLLAALFVLPGKAQQISLSPAPGTIRVCRTYSGTGFSSTEAFPITNGLNWAHQWWNDNRGGGIYNNGTWYRTLTLSLTNPLTLTLRYPIEFAQFDDASSPSTTLALYEALTSIYGCTAVFGPWTQNLTATILPTLKRTNMPFVNTGAAGGALFTPGANPFMVSLLVNGAKRTAPCISYLGTKGVKSAVILYNSDTYMTFVGTVAYPAQLKAANITLLGNFTFDKGNTNFDAIIDQIGFLQPDILVCAEQENDFGPMLQALRTRLPADKQPKAIVNANTTPMQVVYQRYGWVVDTVFGGDQWSTSFLYSDPIFNSTGDFSREYQAYIDNNKFGYQMNFWDAASVIGWFVMMEALQTTVSFERQDVIAALHAVNMDQTFFGPINFLPTGELNSTGICQQFLPFPDTNASLDTTTVRQLQVVAPANIVSAVARYPAGFVKPKVTHSHRALKLGLGIGLGVGLTLLVVIVVLVVVLRHKYEFIFFPKTGKAGATDW